MNCAVELLIYHAAYLPALNETFFIRKSCNQLKSAVELTIQFIRNLLAYFKCDIYKYHGTLILGHEHYVNTKRLAYYCYYLCY